MQNKTILITGGSGFIGTKLTEALLASGYSVIVADMMPPRVQNPNLRFIKINLSTELLSNEYDGQVYGVIHLAGKNIFGRWTESFKKAVYDSRIDSTKNLVHAISTWQTKPQVFVSASAFGFYGNKGEEIVNEDEGIPGNDFLSHVCVEWEKEASEMKKHGVRVVSIRTAHVLGHGGLLAPLFVPFRFGLGAWIGRGSAWLPWVHLEDIVRIYIFALEHDIAGPINTAAPDPVRQKDFMKQFGKAMNKWVLFSIPIFILRLQYGELALTFDNSVQMSSKKLTDAGFMYTYPTLIEALKSIVN